MNILSLILMVAVLAAFLPVAMIAGKHLGRVFAANTRNFPEGVVSLKAEEAIATQFLIGRPGTAATQVLLCDEDEVPAYVIGDTANSDDVTAGVAVACRLLGAGQGTALGIASGTIGANVNVFVADGGKLQAEPTTAGTYYLVGKSVTSTSADGQQIVFTPCAVQKLVVIAALTSSNGTAAGAADLAALKTEAEKIGDDVRAIGAALATASLVKVLSA